MAGAKFTVPNIYSCVPLYTCPPNHKPATYSYNQQASVGVHSKPGNEKCAAKSGTSRVTGSRLPVPIAIAPSVNERLEKNTQMPTAVGVYSYPKTGFRRCPLSQNITQMQHVALLRHPPDLPMLNPNSTDTVRPQRKLSQHANQIMRSSGIGDGNCGGFPTASDTASVSNSLTGPFQTQRFNNQGVQLLDQQNHAPWVKVGAQYLPKVSLARCDPLTVNSSVMSVTEPKHISDTAQSRQKVNMIRSDVLIPCSNVRGTAIDTGKCGEPHGLNVDDLPQIASEEEASNTVVDAKRSVSDDFCLSSPESLPPEVIANWDKLNIVKKAESNCNDLDLAGNDNLTETYSEFLNGEAKSLHCKMEISSTENKNFVTKTLSDPAMSKCTDDSFASSKSSPCLFIDMGVREEGKDNSRNSMDNVKVNYSDPLQSSSPFLEAAQGEAQRLAKLCTAKPVVDESAPKSNRTVRSDEQTIRPRNNRGPRKMKKQHSYSTRIGASKGETKKDALDVMALDSDKQPSVDPVTANTGEIYAPESHTSSMMEGVEVREVESWSTTDSTREGSIPQLSSLPAVMSAVDETVQSINQSTVMVKKMLHILENFTSEKSLAEEGDYFMSALSAVLDTGCRLNSNMISSLQLFVSRHRHLDEDQRPKREVSKSDLPRLNQECPLDLSVASVQSGHCEKRCGTDAHSCSSITGNSCKQSDYGDGDFAVSSTPIKPCVVNLCRLSPAQISRKSANLQSHSWSPLTGAVSSVSERCKVKQTAHKLGKPTSNPSASCAAIIPCTEKMETSERCKVKQTAHKLGKPTSIPSASCAAIIPCTEKMETSERCKVKQTAHKLGKPTSIPSASCAAIIPCTEKLETSERCKVKQTAHKLGKPTSIPSASCAAIILCTEKLESPQPYHAGTGEITGESDTCHNGTNDTTESHSDRRRSTSNNQTAMGLRGTVAVHSISPREGNRYSGRVTRYGKSETPTKKLCTRKPIASKNTEEEEDSGHSHAEEGSETSSVHSADKSSGTCVRVSKENALLGKNSVKIRSLRDVVHKTRTRNSDVTPMEVNSGTSQDAVGDADMPATGGIGTEQSGAEETHKHSPEGPNIGSSADTDTGEQLDAVQAIKDQVNSKSECTTAASDSQSGTNLDGTRPTEARSIYGEKYSNLSSDTSVSSDEFEWCYEESNGTGSVFDGNSSHGAQVYEASSRHTRESHSVRYKRSLALGRAPELPLGNALNKSGLSPAHGVSGEQSSEGNKKGRKRLGRPLGSKGKRCLGIQSSKKSRKVVKSKSFISTSPDSSGSELNLEAQKRPHTIPSPPTATSPAEAPPESSSEEVIRPRKRRGMSSELRQGCFKVFDRVYNYSWSEPFRFEIQKQQVPDYLSVIQTPMYLVLVACKLRQRLYSSVEEFVNDMKLVFQNCRLYHQPRPLPISENLVEAADTVEAYLDLELKKTFPLIDFSGVTGTPYTPETPYRCPSRHRRRKPRDRGKSH